MDPNNPFSEQHLAYLMPIFGAFMLVFVLIYIIPFWMIFKKAGFSPWLALLLFVPLANIITLYIVAFSQWKVAPVAELAGGAYPPAVYPPPSYPAAYPTTNDPPATPPPTRPADPNFRG